jgi:hypothetical protein
MLATMLPRQFDRDAMKMLSHAGDKAVEAAWLWRDVDGESCWQ